MIGELKPNRCMGINSYKYPLPCTQGCKGINPQVSPPIHSDLCSSTAYATREMRYGHIPGSGAYLYLTTCTLLCKTVSHTSPSLGTHLMWSARTHLASGRTCSVMSLKTAAPLTMAKLKINFVWSVGASHTIELRTKKHSARQTNRSVGL